MVEQEGVPTRRLERKLRGRGVALRRARACAAALALRKHRRRTYRDGDAERHQQLPARQPSAIEIIEQRRQFGAHRVPLYLPPVGFDLTAFGIASRLSCVTSLICR